MKLYAGWYIVGMRHERILALVAGPVQDRARAEALIANAAPVARARWTEPPEEGDTFMVAWLALPAPVPGPCNAALWVTGEFQEYDA